MAVRKEDLFKDNTPGKTMAERADRHELYEASVQNVGEECSFITNTFETLTHSYHKIIISNG